jgi:hypothetical protein
MEFAQSYGWKPGSFRAFVRKSVPAGTGPKPPKTESDDGITDTRIKGA